MRPGGQLERSWDMTAEVLEVREQCTPFASPYGASHTTLHASRRTCSGKDALLLTRSESKALLVGDRLPRGMCCAWATSVARDSSSKSRQLRHSKLTPARFVTLLRGWMPTPCVSYRRRHLTKCELGVRIWNLNACPAVPRRLPAEGVSILRRAVTPARRFLLLHTYLQHWPLTFCDY